MPVTMEIDEALCTVRLDGVLDLTSAPELKLILVQALLSGKDLQVELADTAEFDITALQLLWVAARDAKGSGTRCELHGDVPEKLATTVKNAGLASFPIDRM